MLAQCDGPSITISTSADANSISTCQLYDGDVIIDSSASGSISLDGVGKISGDFRATNITQLTALSADQLSEIGGVFELEELIIMSSLSFPSLTAVNQIRLISLPSLQALGFTAGVSRANQVYISNTQLTDLSGIALEAVGTVDVNNNPYLTKVNMPLTNITNSLSLSANGLNLEIDLPNLANVANLTIRNASSLSVPLLSEVEASFAIYAASFSSFDAPTLATVGASLAIVDTEASSLSFSSIQTIGGGLLLSNNTNLNTISFPELRTIVGDMVLAGNFDSSVIFLCRQRSFKLKCCIVSASIL